MNSDYNLEIYLIQANLRNKVIKNGDTLLFIGDSITDTSRSRPIGQAIQTNTDAYNSTGLGSGFVSMLDSFLIANNPKLNLTLLNLGCNGNRVTDLEKRWQRDVIDLKPNLLIILIGINDVWRHFDRPQDPNQVSVNQFEKVYRTIIEESLTNSSDLDPSNLKPQNLILMSPYFLQLNEKDPMRIKMNEYRKVVKNLAYEYQCKYVDLQKAFDDFLKIREIQSISKDKIHMNKVGHTIIVQSFLKTIKDHLPK